MKRPRDPRPYLQDMLDSIERIRRYTENMGPGDFLKDDVVQDAVIRRIEIMGEAVGYLPDDLKARYPEVPWQDIKESQMRRVLSAL